MKKSFFSAAILSMLMVGCSDQTASTSAKAPLPKKEHSSDAKTPEALAEKSDQDGAVTGGKKETSDEGELQDENQDDGSDGSDDSSNQEDDDNNDDKEAEEEDFAKSLTKSCLSFAEKLNHPVGTIDLAKQTQSTMPVFMAQILSGKVYAVDLNGVVINAYNVTDKAKKKNYVEALEKLADNELDSDPALLIIDLKPDPLLAKSPIPLTNLPLEDYGAILFSDKIVGCIASEVTAQRGLQLMLGIDCKKNQVKAVLEDVSGFGKAKETFLDVTVTKNDVKAICK